MLVDGLPLWSVTSTFTVNHRINYPEIVTEDFDKCFLNYYAFILIKKVKNVSFYICMYGVYEYS